jgi:hypothetical protein
VQLYTLPAHICESINHALHVQVAPSRARQQEQQELQQQREEEAQQQNQRDAQRFSRPDVRSEWAVLQLHHWLMGTAMATANCGDGEVYYHYNYEQLKPWGESTLGMIGRQWLLLGVTWVVALSIVHFAYGGA